MSPEELLATVSLNSIETFKQMDVYSMALVLWEVMSQCDVTGTITFCYSIWEHQSKANNEIDWERLRILDQETVDIITKSKEAIHIRHQYPILNRAGGYDLPGIFNHLLSRD